MIDGRRFGFRYASGSYSARAVELDRSLPCRPGALTATARRHAWVHQRIDLDEIRVSPVTAGHFWERSTHVNGRST